MMQRTCVRLGQRVRALTSKFGRLFHAQVRWKLVLPNVLLATLAVSASPDALAQVRYYYDELGRLVQAVAPDGSSVQYRYDAAGNITLVRRNAVNALSLAEFAPNSGPAGTAVTIYGSGFSTTPASNAVSFNGAVAAVTAATANSLVVTVPAGASTGKIVVSNVNGTVSSASDFSVSAVPGAPAIASFSPDIGTPGTVVTVSGANFQSTPGSNKVLVGGAAATVIIDAGSPTANSLKFSSPAGTPSGKVSATTAFGVATSTADFYAIPTGLVPADFAIKGRLVPNAAPQSLTLTSPGKKAVLLFDGQVDQAITLVTSAGTYPAGVAVSVYRPDGTLHESLSLSNSGAADFAKRLDLTGVYTLVLAPVSNGVGSVQLALAIELSGPLAMDGVTAMNLGAGRNARMSFTAEAGMGYGLAVTNLTLSPAGGAMAARLRRSDGTLLTSCGFSANGSCDLAASNFPMGGTYLLDFDAPGVAAASFNALLSKDAGAGARITVDAANSTPVVIAREGQNARHTFSGTGGQLMSIVLTDSTIDDGNAATPSSTNVRVERADGSSIAGGTLYRPATSLVVDVSLPATEIYTIVVNPSGLDKGAFKLDVRSTLTGTLAVDGTTPISLSAGRNARMSFTAEARKGYGLAVTGLTSVPSGSSLGVRLRKSDGTELAGCGFATNGSCDFPPGYFATAGTYLLDFDTVGTAAANFNVALSQDVGGGAAIGVDAVNPTPVTIAREGQNARYTFNGNAGQLMNIVLTGSTLDDGSASTANPTNVVVYRADGVTKVGETQHYPHYAGVTLDLTLPATEGYTVLLNPTGLDKGDINLAVRSTLTGALVVDGSTPISLSPGRNARMSFTAEAGKGYGLGMANLAFVPTGGSVNARLRKSDGTLLSSCALAVGGSCDFAPEHFTSSGVYLLDFDPVGTYAASFVALLSKDAGAGATVAVDAASSTPISIAREGQNARYVFNGVSGQLINIVLTGSALDDGNAGTNNQTNLAVYRPSSSTVVYASKWFSTGNASAVLDLTLPETGPYTLFLNPAGLDKGSINLDVKSTLTGSIAVDGTTPISLSAGRNARLSFTAEASRGYGLAIKALAFSPSPGTMSAILRNADGTQLAICTLTEQGSCDFAPDKFVATGTYLLDFDPGDARAVTFDAVLSKDASGTLIVNAATSTPVTIHREGQNARYTFSGAAGQLLTLQISANGLDDGNPSTGNTTNVYVQRPGVTATSIGNASLPTMTAGANLNVDLPETGTYTVVVNPSRLDKGSISLRVVTR